jgi:hypothetical protein
VFLRSRRPRYRPWIRRSGLPPLEPFGNRILTTGAQISGGRWSSAGQRIRAGAAMGGER